MTSKDILQLYEAFLQDTIEQATSSMTNNILLSLVDMESITVSKLFEIDFFNKTNFRDNNKLSQFFHKQPEGEFGERMKASIEWVFKLKYEKLIILGADSPQIQPNIIDQSIKLLENNDIILGPSAEGGIYLIGIKPNLNLDGFEELFSGVELSNFAKFAEAQSLNITMLPEMVDIDQESDLIGLIAWLDTAEIQMRQYELNLGNEMVSIPKHTLNVIRKIGLTISADESNNRGKKLNKLNSVVQKHVR